MKYIKQLKEENDNNIESIKNDYELEQSKYKSLVMSLEHKNEY